MDHEQTTLKDNHIIKWTNKKQENRLRKCYKQIGRKKSLNIVISRKDSNCSYTSNRVTPLSVHVRIQCQCWYKELYHLCIENCKNMVYKLWTHILCNSFFSVKPQKGKAGAKYYNPKKLQVWLPTCPHDFFIFFISE